MIKKNKYVDKIKHIIDNICTRVKLDCRQNVSSMLYIDIYLKIKIFLGIMLYAKRNDK